MSDVGYISVTKISEGDNFPKKFQVTMGRVTFTLEVTRDGKMIAESADNNLPVDLINKAKKLIAP